MYPATSTHEHTIAASSQEAVAFHNATTSRNVEKPQVLQPQAGTAQHLLQGRLPGIGLGPGILWMAACRQVISVWLKPPKKNDTWNHFTCQSVLHTQSSPGPACRKSHPRGPQAGHRRTPIADLYFAFFGAKEAGRNWVNFPRIMLSMFCSLQRHKPACQHLDLGTAFTFASIIRTRAFRSRAKARVART